MELIANRLGGRDVHQSHDCVVRRFVGPAHLVDLVNAVQHRAVSVVKLAADFLDRRRSELPEKATKKYANKRPERDSSGHSQRVTPRVRNQKQHARACK